MRIKNNNHLMYCLNIHKGEHWTDNFKTIKENVLAIKKEFCPNDEFAVGLRISAAAAKELIKEIDVFTDFLKKNSLYVVTINGFPFGSFHGGVIKEKVYLPDWSSQERVDYTKDLIDILVKVMPAGEIGTISTVPLHYGKKVKKKGSKNIIKTAEYLSAVEKNTGKRIILSLEPEPDCFLDSLASTVKYFKKMIKKSGKFKKYIGVCLDCCHAGVEFEDPLKWYDTLTGAGIEVVKIQISAGLRARLQTIEKARALLTPFTDKEYLHQVRIKSNGKISRYADLSNALLDFKPGELTVHFHVPVTWDGKSIGSTVTNLGKEFFKKIILDGYKHLELETYTYWVLPGKKLDINASIISELNWLKEKTF
ncbi:MAG: hypothetical protein A2452_05400 [Candidatus Firestonebacteria bacterium RIFOXYC2_FULL_39_67]|nr:MAG: hypothetical protein A2536_10230 [Candidatus Firestonebacteria bacterium RIFOXYD2_FULL_39_29]OGF52541.1 MAG: hypothetical protein A2497_02020 [Candidatus Firestonebacteria bacterium RifOxyC12_full_39_7]OGF56375.1 MAG: hypothetical protein A2452_05400 [Candidatus Firestonebacteria bacterium RIFOXYC2_FULL_39_67]